MRGHADARPLPALQAFSFWGNGRAGTHCPRPRFFRNRRSPRQAQASRRTRTPRPPRTMSINPRQIFVSIARAEVGTRETSRNQGPGIAKYWEDTTYKDGYKNREPYCAAFVCWVIAEAIRRGHGVGPSPSSAAVRHIVSWARKLGNGTVVFRPTSSTYKPQPGDLIYWAFGGKAQPNHIGFVAEADGTSRVKTIEANTNPAGSREGDGVYERYRSLSGAAGFIRLSWKASEI